MKMKFKLLVWLLVLLCLPLALSGCGESKSDVRLGNILILGDSYSTFGGHIPEGYPPYYYEDVEYINVDEVEETWWSIVASRCESTVALNESYSGSTVCHTGYGGDCKATSFVTRFERLVEEGYFEKNRIDTVIILGGLNDLWSGAPLGEVKFGEISVEEQYSFLPAVAYLLQSIKATLPEAKILFAVEQDLSEEMKVGIREICGELQVTRVELEGVSKKHSHPDKKGMVTIAKQIVAALENE